MEVYLTLCYRVKIGKHLVQAKSRLLRDRRFLELDNASQIALAFKNIYFFANPHQ